MNKPRTLPIPGLSYFKIYMSTKKKLCTPCFSYKYISMVDVENLLNENQRVISFRTVPKGRGTNRGRSEKNIVPKRAEWHRGIRILSRTSERATKATATFCTSRWSKDATSPENLTGGTWSHDGFPLKENIPFQGLRTSGSMLNFRGVCLDDSSEWSRADEM